MIFLLTVMLTYAEPTVALSMAEARQAEARCVELLWAVCTYAGRCETRGERWSWSMCVRDLTMGGRWGACQRLQAWPAEMTECAAALLEPGCSWPVRECGS